MHKNRKPAIDGHEGRRSVEIILGVYKAAETGKTVKLPLKADPVLKARKAAKKMHSVSTLSRKRLAIADDKLVPFAATCRRQ